MPMRKPPKKLSKWAESSGEGKVLRSRRKMMIEEESEDSEDSDDDVKFIPEEIREKTKDLEQPEALEGVDPAFDPPGSVEPPGSMDSEPAGAPESSESPPEEEDDAELDRTNYDEEDEEKVDPKTPPNTPEDSENEEDQGEERNSEYKKIHVEERIQKAPEAGGSRMETPGASGSRIPKVYLKTTTSEGIPKDLRTPEAAINDFFKYRNPKKETTPEASGLSRIPQTPTKQEFLSHLKRFLNFPTSPEEFQQMNRQLDQAIHRISDPNENLPLDKLKSVFEVAIAFVMSPD
uniref:Eukaryotic translation initiation factor 3 30 kDa subunit n=1 Tax=Caenorhabditis tropicalis TaxID=1561998 RepID=A0A1I7V0T7_9PELO